MANEPTATSAAAPAAAAPAPAPAAPGTPAVPRKQVKAMSPKLSFAASSSPASPMDRAKEYLKDIPVLHARLTAIVTSWEGLLATAKKTVADLEKTEADIRSAVARWEEEQKHVGHASAAAPAAGGGPVANPAGGAAAPDAPVGAGPA